MGDLHSSCQDQMLENHQPFYGGLWAKLGLSTVRDRTCYKAYLE